MGSKICCTKLNLATYNTDAIFEKNVRRSENVQDLVAHISRWDEHIQLIRSLLGFLGAYLRVKRTVY